MKHLVTPPEGIILTMPVAFFKDREMTTGEFRVEFENYMREEDAIWNFRLTNLPTMDVAYVYIVFDGSIQYRANLVMYERNVAKQFHDAPDGKVRSFPASNWVLLTGPIIKPSETILMRGFQGFRYTHKLF